VGGRILQAVSTVGCSRSIRRWNRRRGRGGFRSGTTRVPRCRCVRSARQSRVQAKAAGSTVGHRADALAEEAERPPIPSSSKSCRVDCGTSCRRACRRSAATSGCMAGAVATFPPPKTPTDRPSSNASVRPRPMIGRSPDPSRVVLRRLGLARPSVCRRACRFAYAAASSLPPSAVLRSALQRGVVRSIFGPPVPDTSSLAVWLVRPRSWRPVRAQGLLDDVREAHLRDPVRMRIERVDRVDRRAGAPRTRRLRVFFPPWRSAGRESARIGGLDSRASSRVWSPPCSSPARPSRPRMW